MRPSQLPTRQHRSGESDDATEPVDWPNSGNLQPETIGPYRILETLGRGGMGVVFLAEQKEPVERRLALKLVQHSLREKSALARFEFERQAMARLSHPKIAQIYEAGTTDDGFPYFAMEYVAEGLPLTDFCDVRQSSLPERLRLFLSVCEAVQYAHQRGILHRDLKPDNILVVDQGGQPHPKVIDFGLAKAIGHDAETRLTAGGMVGTLEYMSPESMQGADSDLDTRVDVYALGVILYELIAGQRPFEIKGMPMPAALFHLSSKTPTTPAKRFARAESTLKAEIAAQRRVDTDLLERRLGGDLGLVTMKAIAQDREQRYPSVAALAEEVERYLNQEPVRAHPPSRNYRLRKFVQRNRYQVAASAVALAAILFGIFAAGLGMLQARKEAETARQALSEAEELSDFLAGLFEAFDPTGQRDVGEQITARELLDQGLYKLDQHFEHQPAARARFQQVIGKIYADLADYETAEPLLRDSLIATEAEFGRRSRETARVLQSLASLSFLRGQEKEAEELLRECLEIREQVLGREHPDTARAMANLAALSKRRNKTQEAEALYRAALEIRLRTLGTEHVDVAFSLMGLADVLLDHKEFDEAEKLYLRAVEIMKNTLGPRHLNYASALNALAGCYGRRLDGAAERRTRERALEVTEAALGQDHPRVAVGLTALARIARLDGRLDDAESMLLRALEIRRRIGEPKGLAGAHNALGVFYWRQERYAAAEEAYLQSVKLLEALHGTENPDLWMPRNNLGLSYWRQGNLEDAEPLLQWALQAVENLRGSDHHQVAWPLLGLAGVYRDQGRFEDAEPLYQRALKLCERTFKSDHPRVLEVRREYAVLLRADGREAEAAILEKKDS